MADLARGATDADVVRLARKERRVLLTEDKDFGRIVYAGGQGDIGVVLFRFPATARAHLAMAAATLAERFGQRLPTAFVVVEPGRVRISSVYPKAKA